MKKVYFITIAMLVIFIIDLIDNKAVAQFELSITKCEDSAAVVELVKTVFLDGVSPLQYRNIEFTGDPSSVGYFTGGYIFDFVTPQGIVMSSGYAENLEGANNCDPQNSSDATLGVSDVDLSSLSGESTNDACIIEFDFRPTGDTVRFSYIFGSEEYHDWVGSSYNDVFGFFLSSDSISGTYSNDAINISLVPGTSLPVTISNVNCGKEDNGCTPPPNSGPNCIYLKNNKDSNKPAYDQLRLDAYTVPFVAKNKTYSCLWYHIKLAISDAGGNNDAAYNSGVFLERGSFDPGNVVETTSYSHPTIDSLLYESCNNHDAVLYFGISTPRVDPYIIPYTIGGVATQGTDYILITTGHDDIYIEAGSLYDSLIIRPFWDSDVEGIEDIQIRYNSVMCGFSPPDTAFVYLSDVPPFPDTNLIIPTYCEDTLLVGFENYLEGIPPYTYYWSAGGQTSSSLEYVITGTDSTFLHCVITDTCGFQVSDTAFIVVPDLITDAGPNKSLCNQPDVQLDGTSPGAQDFFWTSDPNDPTLVGQENDSTPVVSPTQTTQYILLATDNCTNSNQDTMMVNLDGAVANASDDNEICLNDSVTMSCNLSNSGETYIWSSIPIDAGLTGQVTNQTIKVSPTSDTKYFVEVTDACNFKANDSVNVEVFNLPVANAGNNDDVCFGTSYNLVASGGVSYQWGAIPVDPTLFINQQDTLANPTVTPDTEANYKYYVEVTNQSGCSTIDTMELTVNHVPNITLSPNVDVICFGNTVTITAVGDVADDYSWIADPVDPSIIGLNQNSITVSPDTSTTYKLTATVGGINCPATPEQQITVIPQLFADFEIVDNKIQTCENDAVGIYYSGNATNNANYTWDFDVDGIINSGTGFISNPYSVQWATEGSKVVTLYLDENGCPSDTVQIGVSVFAMPLPDFSATPESGCAELEVNFTNLSSKLDNPTYTWDIDGTTVDDFETSFTFTVPGTYPISLTTTNQNLCSRMESKLNHIDVFENPIAHFDANPTETIVDDGVINFINNSTSQDIMTYQWYFDDSDSSTVVNPEHKYNTEGLYTVLLIATTINGCKQEYSSDVIVHPDFSIYPPNAFTPNSDGENDKFVIRGTGVSTYYIRIFSRWGELIFESDDIEDSWDGTYKGGIVDGGTYVYNINYRSMLDKEYNIKGTVTVIR